MASELEKDLRCPVCTDIFRQPVVLSCTHSFCTDCVHRQWREKQTQDCPVCDRRSSQDFPTQNLELKNLCEAFLLKRDQTPSGDLCSLHSEKLKLFCLDHQQLVCLVCQDSEIHANHKIRPLEEVAQQHIQILQDTLKPLKDKLEDFGKIKDKFDQTTKYVKVQFQDTEDKITEQFKKLHKFLEEEEEARLSALREEEEQKSQRMKTESETLSRMITDLSYTIRATEETLRAGDVSFLKNYKAAVERVQQSIQSEDPQLPSGALIDVAKHLGNLSFNIWNKMKDMVSYSPVILDPNTAHPQLKVSEDLTTVRQVETQQLPGNPERFDSFVSVLGSEGFTSGTHSWDVEVGDSRIWTLGVITGSFKRNGEEPKGHWRIGFKGGGGYTVRASPHPATFLEVRKRLRSIRVTLDWEKGTLSFSDPDTKALLHTFTHLFTWRLFPFISSEERFRILPSNLSVKMEQMK